MIREVFVIEEYDRESEQWYPVRVGKTRYDIECVHARWPDTAANPKRIVRYVPEREEDR